MRLNRAEGLASLALLDVTILPEILEEFLDDGGMVVGRGAVEDVKVEAEPVVDVAVQCAVLGAKSRRVNALFESLGFGSGSVFILMMA